MDPAVGEAFDDVFLYVIPFVTLLLFARLSSYKSEVADLEATVQKMHNQIRELTAREEFERKMSAEFDALARENFDVAREMFARLQARKAPLIEDEDTNRGDETDS